MNTTDTLRGLRVLIAEDNVLIGESLRDLLVEFGCLVVGPIPDLAQVMSVIEADDIDAALLDIHLGDANIFPAANKLALRGIPYIVTTGDGNFAGLPAVLAEAPCLIKPFDAPGLAMAMDAAFLPRGRDAPTRPEGDSFE